jgi:hypothetical protein
MTDANGSATELITWYFVGRIALQFVFLSLVIFLLFNVVFIILLSMFPRPVREAPEPPLCTCGKWKYCLRDYADCPGNWLPTRSGLPP